MTVVLSVSARPSQQVSHANRAQARVSFSSLDAVKETLGKALAPVADVFQKQTPPEIPGLPDKSLLLQEIKQQPQVMQTLIDSYAGQFAQLNLPSKPPKKLVLIGEGSSKNALDMTADFVSMFTGLPVKTYLPATFEHHFPLQAKYQDDQHAPVMADGLFVALSQSGKSASTLRALEPLAKYHQGMLSPVPLVVMTNSPNAQMAQQYGNHVYLHAGPENSIAATKSMTNSMLSSLLFGLFYGYRQGRTVSQSTIDELNGLPKKMDAFVSNPSVHEGLKAFTKQFAKHDQFILLSSGPVANGLPESGLKMTETSSNNVQTFNTESFKHGPKVLLDRQPATIYIVPPGLSEKEATTFFSDVAEHFNSHPKRPFNRANTYFVRFEDSPTLPESVRQGFALAANSPKVLTLPGTAGVSQPLESMFLGVMTAQLLSYYLAEAKGVNPNHPALSKAVTK